MKHSYRWIESLSLALFVTLAVFTLLSCSKPGQSGSSDEAYNDNTLRIDIPSAFGSLDPASGGVSGSTAIFPLLYSYLFVPNPAGQLEPDLAMSWTYDSSHYTWTIRLRKNAYFHNKQPVTAKDVEYSLSRYIDNLNSILPSSLERVEASSDTTIDIVLNRDDPDYLQKIWNVEIVPKPGADSKDADPLNHPIGSGPFKFQYRDGEKEVGLVANPDYFHGRPSIDRVIFYSFPDRERSWARLLSGKTDIVHSIYPKDYEMIKQYENRFYFNVNVVHQYAILLFNTKDPLFKDPEIRLAFSYAINKEHIVGRMLRGAGVIAAGPMGVETQYHNPAVNPVPYDPDKGLELLKKAGWSYDKNSHRLEKNGKCFEFTMYVFEGNRIDRRIGEYLELCLNEIGIRAHLKSLPYEELVKKYLANTQFQTVLTEFIDARNVPEFLNVLWTPSPGRASLAGCFEQPEISATFQQLLLEENPSVRKELCYKLDDLISSLNPGIFLFQRMALDAMSKRIKLPFPFSLENASTYRLRYASIIKQ